MSDDHKETRARYDIAIVGGGPAGLSAAIWSARYLHSVAVVDSGDPRNWATHGVNGYLGLDAISPPELRARGRETCRTLGVELVDAIAIRVDKYDDEHFEICLAGGGKIASRRLLLAIGVRDVWPDIPGLEHAYGANAHVCPDCDGYDTRDKKVVVIGNGRRAVGMALNLATWTHDIIICTKWFEPEFDEPEYAEKLDALNIPVLVQPIMRVCCEEGAESSAYSLREVCSSTATKSSSRSANTRRTTSEHRSSAIVMMKDMSSSMPTGRLQCAMCMRPATSRPDHSSR